MAHLVEVSRERRLGDGGRHLGPADDDDSDAAAAQRRAGETDHGDAHVPRIEALEEAEGRRHLGGEDRVARVVAVAEQPSDPARTDDAVAVHVDPRGLGGRPRGVEHESDVEAREVAPLGEGAAREEDAGGGVEERPLGRIVERRSRPPSCAARGAAAAAVASSTRCSSSFSARSKSPVSVAFPAAKSGSRWICSSAGAPAASPRPRRPARGCSAGAPAPAPAAPAIAGARAGRLRRECREGRAAPRLERLGDGAQHRLDRRDAEAQRAARGHRRLEDAEHAPALRREHRGAAPAAQVRLHVEVHLETRRGHAHQPAEEVVLVLGHHRRHPEDAHALALARFARRGGGEAPRAPGRRGEGEDHDVFTQGAAGVGEGPSRAA